MHFDTAKHQSRVVFDKKRGKVVQRTGLHDVSFWHLADIQIR
jgi:hypothetical protein